MSDSSHTIGSVVEGLRVPSRYASEIKGIADLIPENEDRIAVIGRVSALLSQAQTSQRIGSTALEESGLFTKGHSNFNVRYQPNHRTVAEISNAMKALGQTVGLTMGTFDIIHIGHGDYLEAAARAVSFLVVGVDSDEKVKLRKGEGRPIVMQDERLRMLAHMRSVDLLTIKNADDPKWHLIRTVMPDVLIATEGTYTEDEVLSLERSFVGKVLELPPQATTSTTARLRKLQINKAVDISIDTNENNDSDE